MVGQVSIEALLRCGCVGIRVSVRVVCSVDVGGGPGAGLHWFAHGPDEIVALPQNKQPGNRVCSPHLYINTMSSVCFPLNSIQCQRVD